MRPLLLALALLASFAAALDSVNNTDCPVNIPGYVHHGTDCSLLCQPASWLDITIFFLGNYVAHAATVINEPGQSPFMTLVNIILALLVPGAGILTGVSAILSRAILAPTSLQCAARAGALCMVVEDLQTKGESADSGDASPVASDAADAEMQPVRSTPSPSNQPVSTRSDLERKRRKAPRVVPLPGA